MTRSGDFVLVFLISVFVLIPRVDAQTTEFTYQGSLQNGGVAATGNFDFEFLLYDALAGGTQVGPTRRMDSVAVTAGIFSVRLDFGSVYPGANRFLEIHVKQTGVGAYTPLAPRQAVTSAPYSVKSLNSDTAGNATQLGGVDAGRFVQQDAGGNVSVTGGLTVAGSLSLNTVNAQTQYNLGGQRVLAVSDTSLSLGTGAGNPLAGTSGYSTFLGQNAGANNIGASNTFAGTNAGSANTMGDSNSFFGEGSGLFNRTGISNSFFGRASGVANVSGNQNSFFGYLAGYNNTAGNNSFFGANAGQANRTGYDNALFGQGAGQSNTVGYENSFFGKSAGLRNTTGVQNSFFGINSGINNTTGSNNTFSGAAAGTTNSTGAFNTFAGRYSGFVNSSGGFNTFVGSSAGENNSTGNFNTFVGLAAGGGNCPIAPCPALLTGSENSFFGTSAGLSNTSGTRNAFVGVNAGYSNAGGNFNSFFGNDAGYFNASGSANNFVGGSAGLSNTTGSYNSFFGDRAGFGSGSGSNAIVGGSNNTMLGSFTTGTANLNFATAVGTNAQVTQSNSIVLGAINGINGAIADTNVGIGTTAPTTRLQIKTASGVYGFTHTDGAITVGSYVGGSSSGATGGWLGTQSNHRLFFFTNNGQPQMTVDTTGNIGVGTTTPGSKLSVAGLIESTIGGVKFPDGTVQTTAGGGSVNAILNQTTPQANANFNIAGNGTVGGTLTANTAQVTGSGFVLGNFGIGTSAPRAKLDVTGGNILIDSPGKGIILKSPDANTCRLLAVDDAGAISLTAVVCP